MTGTAPGYAFLSYSRIDREYAERLTNYLVEAGIEVWWDYEVLPGERFIAEIQKRIDKCSVVVVMLSPDAVNSAWVQREIAYALRTNTPIIPLMVRECPLPFALAELDYVDVTDGRLPDERFLSQVRTASPRTRPHVSRGQGPSASGAQLHRIRVYGLTALVILLTVVGLTLGGMHYLRDDRSSAKDTPKSSAKATPTPTGPVAVGMTGGCTKFRAYAQNRFNPLGSVIRTEPNPSATILLIIAPNYQIFLDGFIHATVAYPLNAAPWNSDIWFHVFNGGWVSYAGVRDVPTTPDPTGLKDGGKAVPTPAICLGILG